MNQIFTLFTTALIASAIAEAPYRSRLQVLPNQDAPSSGPYPASAPYPAPAPAPNPARVIVPHSEYGPPEVNVVPVPVIKTEYTYDIPETPKPYPPAVQVPSGPYPARVGVPQQEYGLPESKVVVPELTGPYPTRVIVPHSEYGLPEDNVVPAPVIQTEYTYDIPETPKPSLPYPPALSVPTGPYPVRVVVPHQEYGLPEIKLVPAPVVKTEYAYEIPQTPAPAPYPVRAVFPVVPHQEYGLPVQTGRYPARVVVPHSEYGL